MEKYKKFNSNQIKLIAIIAMTVDYIAWAVFPMFSHEPLAIIMHIIGRLICPIMCYCIAEGFHYTKNINKYTLRMFIFAFVSHFAYIFASTGFVDWHSFIPFYYGSVLNQTSVMWPLAWGLVLLRITKSPKLSGALKVLLTALICLLCFPADWSCIAALAILAIGTNRGNFKAQMLWLMFYSAIYAAIYFLAIDKVYGLIQLCTAISIPVIWLYNGKRGSNPKVNRVMKWVILCVLSASPHCNRHCASSV